MQRRVFEDKLFQPGEAETLAKAVRQRLREAETRQSEGAETAAQREERAANEALGNLMRRLRPRLVGYAKGSFGSCRDQEIVDEAIQQMALELIRRLKDPRQGELFERKFNVAARYAILDAIRKVGRENGRDEKGEPKGGVFPISWERGFSRTGGNDESPSPSSQEEDRKAHAKLDQKVDALALEQLLVQLPNPKHAQVLRDDLRGLSLKETARRAGISERTATRYVEQALAGIRKLMAEPDDHEGEQSP